MTSPDPNATPEEQGLTPGGEKRVRATLTRSPTFGPALWLDGRCVARIYASVEDSRITEDDPEPRWLKDAMVFVNAVNDRTGGQAVSDLTPDEREAIEARAAMAPGVDDGSPLRPLIDALRSWDGSGPAPDGPDDLAVWRWYDDAARDRSTLLAALTAAEARTLPTVERLAEALHTTDRLLLAAEGRPSDYRRWAAALLRALTGEPHE